MKYFVSLGSRLQDGNYYNSATKYQQYDFRTNIDAKISKSISMSFDIAGRQEDRNYPTRSAGAIFRMVMRGKSNLPAYWPNGLPGPDIEYGDNPVVIVSDATGSDHDKWYAVNSNVKLNIDIPWVSGLTLTGLAAFDKSLEFRKLWQTPWYLYTWDYTSYDDNGDPVLVKGKRGFDAPQLTEYSQDQLTTTLDFLANYDHKFGDDHAIKILAGIEQIKGDGESFNAFRKNFPSPAIPQLFAGGTLDLNNTGTGYTNARLSYFGRVNYNYQEKYLAEFVWRYDGSYIFAEDQRFGFFPGISLGWRVSKENFWKINAINDFKVRASWGKTGNDRINEWQYMATYAYGNPLGLPYYPFVTGTTENQTLYEVRVPNPDVTWEVADQFDVGFDMSLFKSKLNVVADYFYYKRSNILFRKNASVPLTAGIVLPDQNIGRVANQGFDFAVNYHDNIGRLNYQVGINGGYAKNKVLFWDESPGRPSYQQITGHPVPTDIVNNPDAALYYQAIGVFQSQDQIDKTPHWAGAIPGDIIFADVNNDGVIDANDRVRSYKTNVPTFTGGITIDLQYAGFDLSALFQGATGAVSYINTESGEIGNFLQSFADGRTTPDHVTDKPRVFNRTNEYWVNNSNTYWLYNTDYFRLKNLQFGYSLPSSTTKKIGLQNLRVYLSGYNLFTISPDFKDFDPEANNSSSTSPTTTTSGQTYPLQRVVSIGLSVTF
jgi:TonB-linked SusC/RagA family outer membrane protein